MSGQTYGTMTTNSNGVVWQMTAGDKAPPTPSGMIVTRVVEVKGGWVGQIIVDKEIMRETAPYEKSSTALRHVNEFVVGTFKQMFGGSAPKWATTIADDGDENV